MTTDERRSASGLCGLTCCRSLAAPIDTRRPRVLTVTGLWPRRLDVPHRARPGSEPSRQAGTPQGRTGGDRRLISASGQRARTPRGGTRVARQRPPVCDGTPSPVARTKRPGWLLGNPRRHGRYDQLAPAASAPPADHGRGDRGVGIAARTLGPGDRSAPRRRPACSPVTRFHVKHERRTPMGSAVSTTRGRNLSRRVR